MQDLREATLPAMARALVKRAGRIELVEVPAPRIERSDDLVVRVLVAGLCRTDLYVAEGRIACADPVTLGHELCGRVVARGADVALPLGTLVAIDPRIDGFLGVTRHGAFAELVRVPASHAFALPAIDPRAGAYVEPIAAALAVPEVISRGARVGVLAANRFAELLVRVLEAAGHEVVRDEAARVDVAVETTGTAEELARLAAALRPGGMLILKSRTPEGLALPEAARRFEVREVRYGSFSRAAELAASLSLEALWGETFPLARWEAAFAAARHEHHKIFLQPGDASCAA